MHLEKEEIRLVYKKIFGKEDTESMELEEMACIIEKKFEEKRERPVTNSRVVMRIFHNFDTNRNGKLTFDEFVDGLETFALDGSKENRLRFAFDFYDIDRDGFISSGELFLILFYMCDESIDKISLQQAVDRSIRDSDSDGDGKLSFPEFLHAMRHLEHFIVEAWNIFQAEK